ncbi:MAG: hypothetical protein ACI841_002191 [Planctomycetota bacterium]|jgi:hypothetical protein
MSPPRQRRRWALWALCIVPLTTGLAFIWLGARIDSSFEVEAHAWIRADPLAIHQSLLRYEDWPTWYLPLREGRSIDIEEASDDDDPHMQWKAAGQAFSLHVRSAQPTTGVRYERNGLADADINGAVMWELHEGLALLRWVEVTHMAETGWRKWRRFPREHEARKRREVELQSMLDHHGWLRVDGPF